MAGVIWEIDPTSEDATNVSYLLVSATCALLSQDVTPPPEDPIYASSADTEGDPLVDTPRHRNRVIKLKVRITGASAPALETSLNQLAQKIDKLRREQGTLKYTSPTGDTVVFDVLSATHAPILDQRYVTLFRVVVDLEFECKPYGRLAALTLNDHPETALPYLSWVESDIPGDVPALGKLVIDDDQAADQVFVIWGLQSRYYDAAASAGLFYEAEGRTLLGGSTVVTQSGSSGGGSNNAVDSGALTEQARAVLSTRATGGGAHLSHVGTFRVFARMLAPAANLGDVTVAWQWSTGGPMATSSKVTIPYAQRGAYYFKDLGLITIPKVLDGPQQWEGRLVASTNVALDTIRVDYLMLVPCERSGRAQATVSVETPTAFSARDEFLQASGNLNGKVAPVGGSWATSGATTDLVVDGPSDTVRRSVATDGGIYTGRFGILGSANFTNVLVQAALNQGTMSSSADQAAGLIARYVDANNWVGVIWRTLTTSQLHLVKNVAGVVSATAIGVPVTNFNQLYSTLRMVIDAGGRWYVWYGRLGDIPSFIAAGQHADFATGGALASGKPGIYDAGVASVGTRAYAFFVVAVPTIDAAMYASQSLQIRHDAALREDSTGSYWQPVSRYEGDYLLVPCGGREGRDVRFLVKGCRNDPAVMPDPNFDDISARLTITPRVLAVPA